MRNLYNKHRWHDSLMLLALSLRKRLLFFFFFALLFFLSACAVSRLLPNGCFLTQSAYAILRNSLIYFAMRDVSNDAECQMKCSVTPNTHSIVFAWIHPHMHVFACACLCLPVRLCIDVCAVVLMLEYK